MIILLLDNITSLEDQLRQIDKVIDVLINQFSKQNNYLFQKRNTDNQLETNLESEKLKETEKIATAGNNNKTKDWRKGKRKKKTQKQISVTIKTISKILHMKLNL